MSKSTLKYTRWYGDEPPLLAAAQNASQLQNARAKQKYNVQ